MISLETEFMEKHYFISNRTVTGELGNLQFEDNRKAISRVLYYGYSFIDGNGKISHEIKGEFSGEPVMNYTEGVTLTGFAEFFREIYSEMRNDQEPGQKNDVLFFMHGYDVDLKRNNEFLTDLSKTYVRNPNSGIKKILMLHWPSDTGKIQFFGYRREAIDAVTTGELLAGFYQYFIRFLDQYGAGFEDSGKLKTKGYLHLIVQSMGNQVLKRMLEQILQHDRNLVKPVFKEIVLIGADVEDNLLETGLTFNYLSDLCDRVHVYFRRDDVALRGSDISRMLRWGFSSARPLGLHGPRIRNADFLRPNVRCVDVTKIDDGVFKNDLDKKDDHFLHHRYFLYNLVVVEDLVQVFNGLSSRANPRRKAGSGPNDFVLA